MLPRDRRAGRPHTTRPPAGVCRSGRGSGHGDRLVSYPPPWGVPPGCWRLSEARDELLATGPGGGRLHDHAVALAAPSCTASRTSWVRPTAPRRSPAPRTCNCSGRSGRSAPSMARWCIPGRAAGSQEPTCNAHLRVMAPPGRVRTVFPGWRWRQVAGEEQFDQWREVYGRWPGGGVRPSSSCWRVAVHCWRAAGDPRRGRR